MSTSISCDGIKRRDFIKIGALGFGGLSLGSYLRMAQAGEVKPAKGKSAILIYMQGGPSHQDIFDLKPNAPAEFRGEFNPIKTNVAGVEICEHLPKLAKCADKYVILRGVSHTIAAHDLGTRYMNTGTRPIPSLEYPGYSAVVSKERPAETGLPAAVSIPSSPQRPGYLGVQYAALETNSVPQPGQKYAVRGISLAGSLTITDLERRHKLLGSLDTAFQGYERSSNVIEGLDEFEREAYAIISSPKARNAFDISLEPKSVAERFVAPPDPSSPKNGNASAFAQSCLLACRLVEAGVRFVTVQIGGWDTHGQNFVNLKNRLLPTLDLGVSALLTTLADKGLLDSTSVMMTGEFGRTPKINPNAGRDHWPRAMFVMMAGGGMKMGQALGASDDHASEPKAEAITPDQVAASLYHSLGIDYTKEYHTPTGRPVMVVRNGSLVEGLFG